MDSSIDAPRREDRTRPLARRELNLIFASRYWVVVTFQLLSYVGRSSIPWWEPVADFALVLPYIAFCHARSLRCGRIPGWVPFVDSAIVLIWAVLQPESLPSLVGLMVAMFSIAGQSVGRRWLWIAFPLSGVGILVFAIRSGSSAATVEALRYIALGTGVLATVTVVRSSRLAAQAASQHRALHDQLTGLANRELARSTIDRMAPTVPTTVMILDLNNFKEVNDALGHHVGDQLLVAVSDLLRRTVGESGLVARLGGDEFAVVLEEGSRSKVMELADRITAGLRESFSVDGLTLDCGASIGIAMSTGLADSETMVRQADVAMYQAKKAGRPFRFYDAADDRSSVRRVTLLGEMRSAIESGQFEVWYQPSYDLHHNMFTSMEALVRWRHPSHGMLLPGEFIELAEISGAIDDLTRFVIEQSVTDSYALSDLGIRLTITCNLSVRNLHDRSLLDWIKSLAASVGLPPAGLWVELTESQIMEDPAGAAMVLQELAEMGIGSSVDDFGTGYSSMSMLRHLRASALKIDKSFIADLVTSHESRVLVRSMIDLGRNMGMYTVAEGVEDEATLNLLREMKCNVAQGFHLARPMPVGEVPGFLGATFDRCATGVS